MQAIGNRDRKDMGGLGRSWMGWTTWALFACAQVAGCRASATDADAPLFGVEDLRRMRLGPVSGGAPGGRLEAIGPAGGAPVLRVAVPGGIGDPDAVKLCGTVGATLEPGTVCQLRGRLRATRPARGMTGGRARVEFGRLGGGGGAGCEAVFPLDLDGEWEPVQVAFALGERYEGGAAELRVALGWAGQEVEVADLELRSCAPGTDPVGIPVLGPFYRGMEPGAAWRAEAARRIAAYRRAPMELRVFDSDGRPVAGAEVALQMERAAFQFGARISGWIVADDRSESAILYRANLRRIFNAALLEDEFSWRAWNGEVAGFDIDRLYSGLRWLEREGIHVLGHGMVDPAWEALPRAVQAQRCHPARLAASVVAHVEDVARRTRGLVDQWALTRGLLRGAGLFDVYGPEAVADWVRAARAGSAHAAVDLGEDGVLGGGAGRLRRLDATIERLMEGGAAPDGVVLEARFDWRLMPPEDLWEVLDLYARFGKSVTLVNFESPLGIAGVEARYLEDWLLAAFAHPTVRGFYLAGFWERDPWRPATPLFASDWAERAPVAVLRRLPGGEWGGLTRGKTDENGVLRCEVLCGDYEIRVQHESGKTVRQVTLRRPGRGVQIYLEAPERAGVERPGAPATLR